MILSIHGLAFKVHSPSLLEMDTDRPEKVFVMYEQPSWALVYRAADGHTISRTFKSRDAAIELIASRAQPCPAKPEA